MSWDGNGNPASLVNSLSGEVTGRYEYGPFGDPLRTTGSAARANPFRFSTRFTDEETGRVDYGCRYYDPSIGCWINRDPQQEAGGNDLYGFVKNSPVNNVDRDGLDTYIVNRKLGARGGDTSRSRRNPLTHTFICITGPDGTIRTISWGNLKDPKGWNVDLQEDLDAAQGAISKGKAERIGDASFDRAVLKAYKVFKEAGEDQHMNFLLFLNCKTEAQNLKHQAEIYWEAEGQDEGDDE